MDASFAQTSFLGGEISKWAQGQFDRPEHRTSLAKALNVIVTDEGAATRRPGTNFRGTTRMGNAGRIIPFDFAETSPYDVEFTDNYIRFWNGTSLVTSNDSQVVSQISNASPAVFTVPAATTWETGDMVYFTFSNPAEAVAANVLLNRQFVLTMLTTTSFTIADSITGEVINADMLGSASDVGAFLFDGPYSSGPLSDSSISGSPVQRNIITTLSPTVNHIAQLATSYTEAGADWHTVRSVQGLDLAMLLHASVAPQALQVLTDPTDTAFATFSFGTAAFQDGPYLDPPASAIALASGLSGIIQIVVCYNTWSSGTVYGMNVPVTYNGQDYFSLTNGNQGNTPGASPTQWQALSPGSFINNGTGFVQTDVGRHIRLYSAPSAWNSAHTYAAGDNVTYNGQQFTSLQNSNTNNEPDISLSFWTLNLSAAIWTWGVITAVVSANTVTVQINGGNLLYANIPCPLFRIGAWSNTTGWPTCGCYQGGRFWFAGAIPNRVDSSQPDTPFIMSPTEQDGTVTDSSGISYTFNSNSVDHIDWMEPQPQGILVGTKKGEYLLSSGTSNGPITPSSISESAATKYGSADLLPVKTGLTLCFIQRYKRRLFEYLADVFSQRFYGNDLSTYARHLGARGFEELAYQQEPVPIVWGRMTDGTVVGITYRRTSLFSSQKPEFAGWHQHKFGSGRFIESISVGPSRDSTLDTLSLVSNDPADNIRFVTNMTPILDETDPVTLAWYMDSAVVPPVASIVQYGTPLKSYVRFYGLTHLNGKVASVFAAGLDCGDFLIEDGMVDVPLGTMDNTSGYAFDIPQFNILQPLADTFSRTATTVVGSGVNYIIPAVIGYNYQSQGQLCRPMLQQDTGARNGPGFAKKRKQARYGIYLVESLGVRVGTDFTNMTPVPTKTPLGNSLPYLTTCTDIKRDSLKDDNTFDSMLCWETTRPFPATVATFGGFISTEDI